MSLLMVPDFQINKLFTEKSYLWYLKGQCHEIFELWFFSLNNSIWAPHHGLKPFQIWLRIREVIRQSRCLGGAKDTVEANTTDSAMQTWFKITRPQRCH
jgi:hypothetical protein